MTVEIFISPIIFKASFKDSYIANNSVRFFSAPGDSSVKDLIRKYYSNILANVFEFMLPFFYRLSVINTLNLDINAVIDMKLLVP